MFAYLAAQNGRAVPRDELADLLWGEELPATWEKALRVLMTKLRALLAECGIDGSTALTSAFGCYKLSLPAAAWIDVDAAESALERAEAALAAADLGEARSQATVAAARARRSFLPGEDGLWVEEKRRDLREALVRALECLRDASFGAGELAEAVRYAEEVTDLEPFRESGYRRLMEVHAAAGDSAEALRVYERCRRLLGDELGAYPSSETESIYRDLLRVPSRQGRAASPESDLPIPATPFLGRQRELEEMTTLLRSGDVRLLTLTGPAGVGKTRLALQAAAEASDHYPDGVFWAPLAELGDPTLVLEVAAQALEAKDGLDDRIADRHLLLVLDNFEHLIGAASELAGLLAACPNLQLLVTSREILQLPGEQAYPVPPLEPQDATELFTARARAADPRFEPGPIVQQLCARLDNLPLALELAATRVTVLSPEQLLDRLSKRLELLKAGRGVDARQQTLRATIEWSYDLLGDAEKLLFERLSIFGGGCTLEAAEEICAADVDTLQSLINKSLLRRQAERFWMLETIREYAAERLERRGEAVVLADRHADYFIALAEAAARGAPDEDVAQGPGLYPELENFRRALDWLGASGDVEGALRLATGAFWCLWTRASLQELHEWLASALDPAADADAYVRADALGAAALAASNSGEAEVARAYARESLALARQWDDKRQIEWALRVLSFDEPDLDERRRLLHECESLLRELGNDAGLGWVTYLRGMTFVDEGSFETAQETLEQAAALFRALGRRWDATNAEIAAGYALVSADRHAEARTILGGALASAVELGSPASIMEALVLLAAVRMEADAAAATRLLAAVRTIADESGSWLDPLFEGRVLETKEKWARERLGERFEREWQAGSDLTLEEAVALALDEH